jgi:hypothetical protein
MYAVSFSAGKFVGMGFVELKSTQPLALSIQPAKKF